VLPPTGVRQGVKLLHTLSCTNSLCLSTSYQLRWYRNSFALPPTGVQNTSYQLSFHFLPTTLVQEQLFQSQLVHFVESWDRRWKCWECWYRNSSSLRGQAFTPYGGTTVGKEAGTPCCTPFGGKAELILALLYPLCPSSPVPTLFTPEGGKACPANPPMVYPVGVRKVDKGYVKHLLSAS
jgi:hypothetical protein